MSLFDDYIVQSPEDGIFGHKFYSEIGGGTLNHKFKTLNRLITEIVLSDVDHCLRLTDHGLALGEAYYTSPVHDLGGGQGMIVVQWVADETAGSKIDNDTMGLIFAKVIEVRGSGTPPVLDILGNSWVNDKLPNAADTIWGTSGTLQYVFVQNGGTSGFNRVTGDPEALPQGRYVQFRVRLVGPSSYLKHKFTVP